MSRGEIQAAIKEDDEQIKEEDKQTESDDGGREGGLPPAAAGVAGYAAVVAAAVTYWFMKTRGGRNKATGAEAMPAVDAAQVLAAAAPPTFANENVLGSRCASAAVCLPAGEAPSPERAPLFAAPVATPGIRQDAPPGQAPANALVVPEPVTLLVDGSGSPPQLPETPVSPAVALGGGTAPTRDDLLANPMQTGVVLDASDDQTVLSAKPSADDDGITRGQLGEREEIVVAEGEELVGDDTTAGQLLRLTDTSRVREDSLAVTEPYGHGASWLEEPGPKDEQPVSTSTDGAELYLVDAHPTEEAEGGHEWAEVAAEEEPWSPPVSQVTETVYAITEEGSSDPEGTEGVEELLDADVDAVTVVVATDDPAEEVAQPLAADPRDALGDTDTDKYGEVKPAEPFRNAGSAVIEPVPAYPDDSPADEGDTTSDSELLNGPGVLIAVP